MLVHKTHATAPLNLKKEEKTNKPHPPPPAKLHILHAQELLGCTYVLSLL